MKPNYDWETNVKLKSDETPAKKNSITGEYQDVIQRPNNIPEDKIVFQPTAIFRKDYTNSWKYLKRILTPTQYKAAHTLAIMAKANTNSLEPLNDETTLNELMEVLDVSINRVKPILLILFDLGIYGKFEVKQADRPYTKYWIFNPYLSFSGKLIHSDIASLFAKTHIANAFYDEYYNHNPNIKD